MEKSTTLQFCVKDAIKGGLLSLFCFAVVIGVCTAYVTVLGVIVEYTAVGIVVDDVIDTTVDTIAGTTGICPIDAGLFIVFPVVAGIPMLIGGIIYGGALFYTHKKYGPTVNTAFVLGFTVGSFILILSSCHY